MFRCKLFHFAIICQLCKKQVRCKSLSRWLNIMLALALFFTAIMCFIGAFCSLISSSAQVVVFSFQDFSYPPTIVFCISLCLLFFKQATFKGSCLIFKLCISRLGVHYKLVENKKGFWMRKKPSCFSLFCCLSIMQQFLSVFFLVI